MAEQTRAKKKKVPKPKALEVAALNVAAHPHSDSSVYEKLFRECVKGRISAQYHGRQTAVVSRFHKQEDIFVGMLATFFPIDSGDVWGNPLTGEEATEEELDQISLPENLVPSFKSHTFVFFPDKHRVVVDATDLSPNLWWRAIRHLLENAGRRLSLEKVVTTLEPKQDSVETVLSMDVKRLTITLERPNPDDLESLDAEVAERMKSQNVAREVRDLKAQRGYSIDPDQGTLMLADVAKSNGKVVAVGYVDGVRDKRSTRDYPWTEQIVLGAGPIVEAKLRALRAGLEKLFKVQKDK